MTTQTTPTTTAQLREAARAAESRLDWSAAADLFQRAADAYPARLLPGALAKIDVESLRRREKDCRRWAAKVQNDDSDDDSAE